MDQECLHLRSYTLCPRLLRHIQDINRIIGQIANPITNPITGPISQINRIINQAIISSPTIIPITTLL
jgi:hypothetical protein